MQKPEIILSTIVLIIAFFLIGLAIESLANPTSGIMTGMMGGTSTNNTIPILLIIVAVILIVALLLYLVYFRSKNSGTTVADFTPAQTLKPANRNAVATEDLRPFEIFLCYKKSSGRDFADHLKTGLEELGFHTFEDCRDIPQTVNTEEGWACVRDKALTESKFFLLIMTSGFDLSKEVIKELSMARKLGDKTFIFFRHRSLGRNIVVHLENEELDIGKLEQVSFESKEELLRLAHNILIKS